MKNARNSKNCYDLNSYENVESSTKRRISKDIATKTRARNLLFFIKKMNNKIKIILVAIATIWIFSTLYVLSIDEKIQDAKNTVQELIELKDAKQKCKDDLSREETIEEYKGIQHCNTNDEKIIELKKSLEAIIVQDYEQTDQNIEMKKLWLIADAETWKFEMLESFLLSE